MNKSLPTGRIKSRQGTLNRNYSATKY